MFQEMQPFIETETFPPLGLRFWKVLFQVCERIVQYPPELVTSIVPDSAKWYKNVFYPRLGKRLSLVEVPNGPPIKTRNMFPTKNPQTSCNDAAMIDYVNRQSELSKGSAVITCVDAIK